MQALNAVLSLPFPPYMTVAILAVALFCSAIAFIFAHKRANQAIIWVASLAAIVFVFVGGHFLPPAAVSTLAGMRATLDGAALSFLMLMPIFTILSVIKPPRNDDGGVPPMG